jgi:NADH:ubiquinone reductase (H+-translocating)
MVERPRVVILGGGFAGLGAAAKLKAVDADLVLIDQHTYHTFQPMLYQAATSLIGADAVGHPLRDVLRNHRHLTIHTTSVTGIDLANRAVQLQGMAPLTYDYLVLALGATVNFFGVNGAADHAFPLYTLADAVRLKAHMLRKWEAADKDPARVADGALNIVVVGGGPTGVESAGAIIELYRDSFVQDYPTLPAKHARVTLVESAPALLGVFKKDIQIYTKRALAHRGVDVRLGDRVVDITSTRVTLESGTVLKAHTLVWGAGLQANPLVHSLGVPLEQGGRVPVRPDLSLQGHPEVFVTGDVAWIIDRKTKQVLPQLGSVAIQSGERAGENIARRIAGNTPAPFTYVDKGMMATIGRGAAVVQLGRHTLKGKLAFIAWAGVHLALLSGSGSRARTMVDWGWAAVTRKRTHRITIDPTEP